jgi:hypothetical protein
MYLRAAALGAPVVMTVIVSYATELNERTLNAVTMETRLMGTKTQHNDTADGVCV